MEGLARRRAAAGSSGDAGRRRAWRYCTETPTLPARVRLSSAIQQGRHVAFLFWLGRRISPISPGNGVVCLLPLTAGVGGVEPARNDP